MIKRQHLAAAAFYDAPCLWEALDDLARSGFSPGQLCLAGQPESIGRMPLPAEPLGRQHSELLKLAGNLVPITAPEQKPQIVASRGPLLEELRANPQMLKSIGLLPGPDSHLCRHLSNRGVILLFLADTPEEQNLAAQVLLRQSRHGVVTHDIATPN